MLYNTVNPTAIEFKTGGDNGRLILCLA